MARRSLEVVRASGYSPGVGQLLAMMDDVRARTVKYVEGLSADQLSWYPQENVESIGTLLLHVVAAEHSYIQEDIMRRPMGEEWKIAFPIRFGIKQIQGEDAQFYLDKLDSVRADTKEVLRSLTDEDLGRTISPLDPGDDASFQIEFTIEWLLYHLIEHEAHHKGQIALMKRLLPV